MGFAEGPIHIDSATGSGRRGFPGHAALADARRSHHIHDAAVATDRAVDDGVDGRHLPVTTDQACLGAPDRPSRGPIATSRCARTGSSEPLIRTHSGSARSRQVFDESTLSSPTASPRRGGSRLHSLRHPDVFAGGGVAQRPRADVTGDHLT